jgi:hypothetical protein
LVLQLFIFPLPANQPGLRRVSYHSHTACIFSKRLLLFIFIVIAHAQGCQIFIGTYQHTKNGKSTPNNHKSTKWTQTVPNSRKIDQMAL